MVVIRQSAKRKVLTRQFDGRVSRTPSRQNQTSRTERTTTTTTEDVPWHVYDLHNLTTDPNNIVIRNSAGNITQIKSRPIEYLSEYNSYVNPSGSGRYYRNKNNSYSKINYTIVNNKIVNKKIYGIVRTSDNKSKRETHYKYAPSVMTHDTYRYTDTGREVNSKVWRYTTRKGKSLRHERLIINDQLTQQRKHKVTGKWADAKYTQAKKGITKTITITKGKYFINGKISTAKAYKTNAGKWNVPKILPSFIYNIKNTPYHASYVKPGTEKSYLIPKSEQIKVIKDTGNRVVGIIDPGFKLDNNTLIYGSSYTAPDGTFFNLADIKKIQTDRIKERFNINNILKQKIKTIGKNKEYYSKGTDIIFKKEITFKVGNNIYFVGSVDEYINTQLRFATPQDKKDFSKKLKAHIRNTLIQENKQSTRFDIFNPFKYTKQNKFSKEQFNQAEYNSLSWYKKAKSNIKSAYKEGTLTKKATKDVREMFNPIIQGLKNIYSAQGLLMKYVTKHKLKDAEQIKLQLNTAISLVYKIKSKGHLTKEEINKLQQSFKEIKAYLPDTAERNKILKEYRGKILNKDTVIVSGILVSIPALIGVMGLLSAATLVKLETVGAVVGSAFVVESGYRYAKKPTVENLGNVMFQAAFEVGTFYKTLGKIINRPMVKNVDEFIDGARVLIKDLKIQKKATTSPSVLKKINKNILYLERETKNALKVLNDLYIIKARNMNPLLSSSKLKAMAKKATNLFHVAEESPSVMKLFSKKTISKLTNREISQLIKTTISKKQVSKILPSLTKTTNIDKVLIDYITDTGGVVYGGKATEVYTSKLRKIFGFRKSTTDFDVLYTTPKKNRDTLYNYLTNRYPGRKFSLSKVKGRETYSISYQGSKIIDFSKKGKNVKYVYNVDGTRIIAKSEQAKTLIAAFYTVGDKKLTTRLKDLKALSKGKISKSDLLKIQKHSKKVFKVREPDLSKVSIGRRKAGEFYFYSDFKAALGYAKGKPYSIIEIVGIKAKDKIKFSKSLIARMKQSERGTLNLKQISKLRSDLNKFIQSKPGKFSPGVRALAQGRGESEIINNVGDMFKLINTYKVYDPEFGKFMDVARVTLMGNDNIKTRNAIMRFWNAWKKNPLTRLKYKLNPTDFLELKRFKKIKANSKITATLLDKIKDFFIRMANKIKRFKISKIYNKMPQSEINKEIVRLKKVLKNIKKTKDKRKLNLQIKFLKQKISKRSIKIKPKITKLKKRVNTRKYKKPVRRLKTTKLSKKKVKIIKPKIIKKKTVKTKATTRKYIKPTRRLKVRPIIRPKARARIKPKARAKVRPKARPKARPRLRVKPKARPRVKTRAKPKARPRVKVRARPKPRPRIIPRPKPKPRPRVRPRPIPRPRPVPRLIPRPRPDPELFKKQEKVIKTVIKKNKFIYLPDLYSILYNVKASKAEKAKLLKKGAVFSGVTIRKLV